MATIRYRCTICKKEIGPTEQRCIAVTTTGAERHSHYPCEVEQRARKGAA